MSSFSSHNDLLQCVGNNNFFHHYRQKINSENVQLPSFTFFSFPTSLLDTSCPNQPYSPFQIPSFSMNSILTFPSSTKKLFVNLRNAAASWGTESKQYKEVHKMVYDHLREMQAQGKTTDLSGVRQKQQEEADGLSAAFQKLDLELRDQEGEDKMQE